MTNQNADLPTRLAAFCQQLPGARWEGETEFRVLDGFLDGFARFYAEPSPELLFRCRDADRAKHPDLIRVSERMAWDPEGWQWCDAALDGSLPAERLEELIRTSYELVLEEKDDVFREYLDIVSRRLPPRALLSALLDGSDLESKRDVIEGLLRPTLLLRTSKPDGDAAPGATRIGGTPDLPASIDWPVHAKTRRPLAFLVQINFGEVPAEHRPPDFPAEGILYVFTVYGWQTDDDSDPDLPKGKPQPDWTQLRFEPSPSRLVPTPTPAGVNAFPATRVEFVPILTLPADVREPVFPKKFTGRTREEYESL